VRSTRSADPRRRSSGCGSHLKLIEQSFKGNITITTYLSASNLIVINRFKALRDIKEFDPLYAAADSRRYADWYENFNLLNQNFIAFFVWEIK
jgi:hypothetical protein